MSQVEEFLTKKLALAIEAEEKKNDAMAIKLLEEVIKKELQAPDEITDTAVKAKEQAAYKLAAIFKEKGLLDELVKL